MNSIVKYQAAIALLVTILSNFSDCNYCPASAPTVSVVSKCPTNKTEWDQAASRKKCNLMSAKCGDKTPVYHCLLNQWRNETVEVCASTWYISGFCAVYNTDEMKVIDDFERDCTKFSEGKCLTRYISSEAYLYQKCYMQKSSNRSIRTEETEETNDCILSTIIAIVVTVLVLVITSLVVFITLRLKISKKAQDEECMLFCNATTQIRDKNERENLLEKNGKENAEPKGVFKKVVKPKVEHTRKNNIEFSSCKNLNNEENTDIGTYPAAEKENAVQKVNEEIRVNQTKKTAESSSCGDPVELKQKPDIVETCGVDRSKPPVVSDLLAKYEPGKTRGQTPNESLTNSSNAKPKDKENAVPKRLFQKEVEPKVDHTTKNNIEFSSCKNLNNEENTDMDPAAEKGNAVQKDVKQKADQTIRSHRNSIIGEENVEERENSPDPTPSETGIKAPNTKAKDPAAGTGNAVQNEIDQKVDHTVKNDVDFPSHGNPTNEENTEDENNQSPDSTPRECVTNTTDAKSQDPEEYTENCIPNEKFKQKADDTNDGGVSPDKIVQDRKQFWEMKLGAAGESSTPKARTTPSSFGDT